MQTKAYTDYFGDCEEVTLLSHDGDKYAKVKRENGEVLEIKTGYIYKAPFKFSQYPEIKPKRFHGNVWWELQGKNPKYYKHRKEKFNYGSKDYWRVAEDWTKHPTLKEAVLHAHKISLKIKDFVKVSWEGNRNVDVFVFIYVNSVGGMECESNEGKFSVNKNIEVIVETTYKFSLNEEETFEFDGRTYNKAKFLNAIKGLEQ